MSRQRTQAPLQALGKTLGSAGTWLPGVGQLRQASSVLAAARQKDFRRAPREGTSLGIQEDSRYPSRLIVAAASLSGRSGKGETLSPRSAATACQVKNKFGGTLGKLRLSANKGQGGLAEPSLRTGPGCLRLWYEETCTCNKFLSRGS